MNHAIITATQETFIQQLTLLKKMQREIISVKKVPIMYKKSNFFTFYNAFEL